MATTIAPHIYRALINFKLHGELHLEKYIMKAIDMDQTKAIARLYPWDNGLQRLLRDAVGDNVLILHVVDHKDPRDPVVAALLVLSFAEDENYDAQSEIDYWIAPTHHGRGLASKMLKLVSDHAFRNWNIGTLVVKALKNSLAVEYTLQRAGFKATGTLKGKVTKYAEALHTLYRKQNPRLYPEAAGE